MHFKAQPDLYRFRFRKEVRTLRLKLRVQYSTEASNTGAPVLPFSPLAFHTWLGIFETLRTSCRLPSQQFRQTVPSRTADDCAASTYIYVYSRFFADHDKQTFYHVITTNLPMKSPLLRVIRSESINR